MTDLSRRGFLGAILAAAVAPAIIRTPGLIMPVKPILDLRPMNPDYLDGLIDRLQRALCEPILVRAEHLAKPYAGAVIVRLDPSPRPFRHPDLVALDEARAKLIAEERFGTFVPGMAVSA